MEIKLFIFILLIHFLADFGLQTHEQATKKGESNRWLAYHVGVYSIIWWIASYVVLDSFLGSFIFTIITFVTHFGTDFVTSRVGKPFWEKGDLHNGFVVIGFDQLLHYTQLILTFTYLMQA